MNKEWKKLETLPAWQLEKVKSKKEVIKEAQKNNNKMKVYFATLMDMRHIQKHEYIQENVRKSDLKSGSYLCTFVPFSWMCNEQTSVSHSFTESEIISLDAGLRMNGSLALDL